MPKTTIKPLDQAVGFFDFMLDTPIPNGAALMSPLDRVMTQSYMQKTTLMKTLLNTVPELQQVFSVAVTQVAAHIPEITAGRNTGSVVKELFQEADEGDGWQVFVSRMFRDYIACGWAVAGNEFAGPRIVDFYHIDAGLCKLNVNEDKRYERRRYPLMYQRTETLLSDSIPLERRGSNTECWWVMAEPRSKEEVRRSLGWQPSQIPLLGIYDAVRSLMIGRAIQQANELGDAVTKVVFVKGQRRDVVTEGKGRAKQQRDVDKQQDKAVGAFANDGMNTIFIPVLGDLDVKEIQTRVPPTEDELERRRRDVLTKASALMGVNPIDVDPSLSGAGGLSEGTKAKLADDLRDGRRVAQFMRAIAERLMQWTLPSSATVTFTFSDPRDEVRRLANKAALVTTYKDALASGLLTQPQAIVDAVYEEAFAPETFNAGSTAETVTTQEADDTPDSPPNGPPEPPSEPTGDVAKAREPVTDLDAATLKAARAIYDSVKHLPVEDED